MRPHDQASSSADDENNTDLYDLVRSRAVLRRAWAHIRSNATSKDASRSTKLLAQQFADREDLYFDRVKRALQKRTFIFPPARGVAIPKPGKSTKRPLFVFSIEARIIQRAILEVAKEIPEVNRTLKSGFNFGGIEGKNFGVPAAVQKAAAAMHSYGYFIRSDIKSFFDSVTRDSAISSLTKHVKDKDFIELLRAATSIELANRQELGVDAKLFPSSDYGLAQGSCLSPLLCNLVLEEFDNRMNSLGVICIRYIDDFVLFAKDRSKAKRAMRIGLDVLKRLNLSAYQPHLSPQKAEEGDTEQTLSFLGCEISKRATAPSLSNRRKLLSKVDKLLESNDNNLVDAVSDVSQTMLGWGNTFGFCNDELSFRNLDIEIQRRIRMSLYRRLGQIKHEEPIEWLRKFGVQPLKDRTRP